MLGNCIFTSPGLLNTESAQTPVLRVKPITHDARTDMTSAVADVSPPQKGDVCDVRAAETASSPDPKSANISRPPTPVVPQTRTQSAVVQPMSQRPPSPVLAAEVMPLVGNGGSVEWDASGRSECANLELEGATSTSVAPLPAPVEEFNDRSPSRQPDDMCALQKEYHQCAKELRELDRMSLLKDRERQLIMERRRTVTNPAAAHP